MSDRIFSLLERHQKLDRLLADARRGRWVDPLEVLRLKKLKRAVKDRIAAALLRKPARA